MIIGFSSGSLAKSDFRTAIEWSKELNVKAIELSALRESEIYDLIDALETLDLSSFEHVSFHAPSKLTDLDELGLVNLLEQVAYKKLDIIVHPDIITDYPLWRILGDQLCIENMDNRKKIGQSVEDMQLIFEFLPEASFCFDIAHSRQIDPTMQHAFYMNHRFRDRLKQVHISHVNQDGGHEPLNDDAILDYMTFSCDKLIPHPRKNIPIIIESPVSFEAMASEIEKVKEIFNVAYRQQ